MGIGGRVGGVDTQRIGVDEGARCGRGGVLNFSLKANFNCANIFGAAAVVVDTDGDETDPGKIVS